MFYLYIYIYIYSIWIYIYIYIVHYKWEVGVLVSDKLKKEKTFCSLYGSRSKTSGSYITHNANHQCVPRPSFSMYSVCKSFILTIYIYICLNFFLKSLPIQSRDNAGDLTITSIVTDDEDDDEDINHNLFLGSEVGGVGRGRRPVPRLQRHHEGLLQNLWVIHVGTAAFFVRVFVCVWEWQSEWVRECVSERERVCEWERERVCEWESVCECVCYLMCRWSCRDEVHEETRETSDHLILKGFSFPPPRQFDYYNSMVINSVDEDGNSLELGGDFPLEENEHFNKLLVNTLQSDIQVPTNVYNKGQRSPPWAGLSRGSAAHGLLCADPNILNAVYNSEALNDVFIGNFQKDPTLTWQFFGSSTGFFRIYPGQPRA